MAHPPTPTALRLVQQGGKLRSRHSSKAKREPVPVVGLTDPPTHLNAEQLAIWQRLSADSPDGLLTKVDADLFEGYCVMLQARNQAARHFNATGAAVLIKSDASHGAYVVNPYLKEYRRLTELLRTLQGELGYSPASRTRIAITPQGSTDPLDRFLGGGQA